MSRCLNFTSGCVHEVAAMLGGNSVLIAGHFDSTDAADAAIAHAGDYRAVWSTLNTLATLPASRVLNPPRLTRGSRAGAQHVGRRVSLLFDFDPPRPANTMSTDSEHEAALTQARECRMWLRLLGWPLLPLCNSGSGAHLRAYVDMDASAENTRLIQRVLRALQQRYSFVDSTASDLPRLCRYYGTWNRKSAENNPERPWRQSGVLDEGEQRRVPVTQLDALCELMSVPKVQAVCDGVARPEAQEKFVRRFATYCQRIGAGVDAVRQLGDGTTFVQTEFCLLNEDHTGSSCGVGVGPDGVRKNLCKHAGCAMPWARWSRLVEEKYGEPMRLDGAIKWKR
jgi:hypothetical protein